MPDCKSCGAYIPNNATSCPKCGEEVRRSSNVNSSYHCPNCGAPRLSSYTVCPKCGKTLQNTIHAASPSNYSMKWHYVVLVLFYIGAIMNLISGIRSITGGGIDAQYFRYYSGLLTALMFVGITTLILCVLQFMAAVSLGGYKRNAIKNMNIAYIGGIVIQLIQNMILTSYGAADWASVAIGIVLIIVEMVINNQYYGNRCDLFVN